MHARNPLLSVMAYYTRWLIGHDLHLNITWQLPYWRLKSIQYIAWWEEFEHTGRSSHPDVLCKKGALKNFTRFTEEATVPESLFY